MSEVRGLIAVEGEDGQIRSITVRNDGFPAETGKLLIQYYKTEEAVKELLALGDLRYLGVNTTEASTNRAPSIDMGERRVCETYAWDWGKPLCPTDGWKDLAELLEHAKPRLGIGFVYLFRNGEWYLAKGDRMVALKPFISTDEA